MGGPETGLGQPRGERVVEEGSRRVGDSAVCGLGSRKLCFLIHGRPGNWVERPNEQWGGGVATRRAPVSAEEGRGGGRTAGAGRRERGKCAGLPGERPPCPRSRHTCCWGRGAPGTAVIQHLQLSRYPVFRREGPADPSLGRGPRGLFRS